MPLWLGRFGPREARAAPSDLPIHILLQALSEVALEAVDLPVASQLMLDAAMEGFRSDAAALVGIDERAPFEAITGGSLTAEAIASSPILQGSPSLGRQVFDSQRAAAYIDLPALGWLGPPAWPRDLNTVVLAPLRFSDETGIVAVIARNAPFDETELAWVESYWRVAGSLLDRLTLRQQNEALANQNTDLEQAKTGFLARVTHEFRTPLSSIKASTDMLLELAADDSSPTHLKLLKNVSRNVERLTGLVNDLLDVARLQTAALRFDPQPMDLRPLVGQSISVVGPIARARRQSIDIDMPAGHIVARVDPQRFEQILINLLTNASNFTPVSGRITVRARRTGGQIVVDVIDNGNGIPEREQPMIFEPFYRGNAAEGRQVSGTGLGLAIVKSLVEMHGGTVSLKSAPGEGSTFTVSLPSEVTV